LNTCRGDAPNWRAAPGSLDCLISMAIALERPKRDHKDLTRMRGANRSNMIELGALNSVVDEPTTN
jgi:hypothetical protein